MAKRWYSVSVLSNFEKKVAEQIRQSVEEQGLEEQIDEVLAEGHKALVFSQFTSLLSIVRERFDKREIVYEYLDGQTRKRDQRVNDGGIIQRCIAGINRNDRVGKASGRPQVTELCVRPVEHNGVAAKHVDLVLHNARGNKDHIKFVGEGDGIALRHSQLLHVIHTTRTTRGGNALAHDQ